MHKKFGERECIAFLKLDIRITYEEEGKTIWDNKTQIAFPPGFLGLQ